MTTGIERTVDLEPVLHAGQIVIGAMTGRGVNRTGSGIEGDVVTDHGQRVATIERMFEYQSLEHTALERRNRGTELTSGFLSDVLGEILRDDDDGFRRG